jgi:3-methyladenine DNA glycosylase Mpg
MATKAKAKKTTAKKTVKKTAKKTNGSGKSEQVIALMRRANGVTRAEVLELTDWSAVSMQQLAKSAGVKLTVDKSERPYRYRARTGAGSLD